MAVPASPQSTIDGRFVLEEEHKRGGMGTVWRARDLQTERLTAVKVLHQGGGDLAERFVREGALLAQLRHPAIVSYLAHGTTAAGVPYLAMEWLEGETLAERLARQPLSLSESLTLVRAALRGLAVMHGRAIVHRDLKPSNLFLRQRRLDDVVVLDLGIARWLDGAGDLTRTGSILGTPSYMAPEQAQGRQDLTPAADVFSLGCVLFECLTGELPFVGAHVFSVLAKLLFEEPARPRDLRPELPEPVDALVGAMLVKDPARRVQDAGGLIAALDALGEGRELAAPRSLPRPAPATEQELVSVVLATRDRPGPEPELPDLSDYGAEPKRLADGTVVITLAQRGGAATDLAGRAARCALRLRDGRPGWSFVLATGRGIRSERVHIGEAVDRAGTILRALAERAGGAVWLDEVTAGLLDARFATTRVEDGLFALSGEDPSVDPGRPLLGRPTTCVGREHELGMLDLAVSSAVDESSPRAVLVLGPPGIGKSRLRHELLRRLEARPDGPTVLLGLGDPIRTAGGRGLLGSALARLCQVRSELSDEENRTTLERRIGRSLPAGRAEDRLRTIVFIGELCGVSFPAGTLPELRAARQSPNIMADLMTQAWLAFVRAEAARSPLVLVLDDLQWSDARTIALVGAALRDLPSSPLMVLALARPEAQELFPELWAPGLTTIPLRPLALAATARLVRQVLGGEVSDDSIDRIARRAGGNALYLEELIRAAEEKRDAVPGTVLAMLQARIGLLAAAPRRALRAASVFGEDFPLAGLEALLRAEGAAVELEPVLATLCRNEILERQPDGRGRFRHALMRDAAYALGTPEELATWHARAARLLETGGEDPAVVASHLERAGDLPQAVRQLIAAAEQAFARSDLAGAVALVERGAACGAAGEELGVLRGIEAYARFFRNELVAGEAASQQALALLPAGHSRYAFTLSTSIYLGLHLGRGIEVARHVEELVAIEPAAGDRAGYVRALGDVLISYTVLGNRAEARRLLERASAVERDDDLLTRGHNLYWRLRFEELLGDDPHAAWRAGREAVACYQRSGDRRMLAYTQVEVGECVRRLFSVTEGLAVMREAVALARELREAITTSFVEQYLANLLAEHGAPEQLEEARALALESAALGGDSVYSAFGRMALAVIHLRTGALASAEDQARKAHELVHRIGLAGYFPHVDTTLVQVLLARDEVKAAEELADQVQRQLDEQGPFGTIELSSRLIVARAQRAAGRSADAAAGVSRALDILARRSAAIADPALRRSFLTAVPEHAGLRALALDLGLAPPAGSR